MLCGAAQIKATDLRGIAVECNAKAAQCGVELSQAGKWRGWAKQRRGNVTHRHAQSKGMAKSRMAKFSVATEWPSDDANGHAPQRCGTVRNCAAIESFRRATQIRAKEMPGMALWCNGRAPRSRVPEELCNAKQRKGAASYRNGVRGWAMAQQWNRGAGLSNGNE